MAKLYTDGACRGNGGIDSLAGAGAIIYDKDDNILAEISEFLGKGKTNNIAEYRAMLLGLERSLDLGINTIYIYTDSKLIVKQVKGEWRVKDFKLIPLHKELKDLLKKFEEWDITHIYRNYNKEADKLANLAIDNR